MSRLRTLPASCAALLALCTLVANSVARAQDAGATRARFAASTPAAGPRLAKVDLRDLALGDACRLLSDQTGWNIVASEDARASNVTLYMKDVDALTAIESLCRMHKLWYQRDEAANVVRIHTVREYRRNLVTLQEEKTEYFTLLYPNALDVGYAIRNLFGGRVELRTDDTDEELYNELQDRFQRFDMVDRRTQGLGLGGQGFGGAYGGSANEQYNSDGVLSGSSSYGTTTQNRDHRGGLLGESSYDAPGQFAQDAQRANQELGIDEILAIERLLSETNADGRQSPLVEALAKRYASPIHVSVARRQNKLIVRTGDEQALEQIREIARRLDVPTALVLLEVRVLAIDLLDGMSSFFDYQFTNDNTSGSFAQGNILPSSPPPLGPAGTGLRSGDLIFQFVDQHFGARMQVLQRDNRVRAISTPVLLTANNEVSRLFVGREVPLNRSFGGGSVVTNESTTNTVTGSTAIEFRPVGTTLLITPNINADRTVTLRIVQETSNTDSTASVLIPSADGFVPAVVSVVSSQSVSGTIVAQSDMAVVFGGLIDEGVKQEKDQVPILGDVPLLGLLFQRKNDVETRREIVIVVRPYVLSTPAESEATSRRLLDALGVESGKLDLHADRGARASNNKSLPIFRVHGLDGADG